MFFFTPMQLRIIAANAVGVIYLFALCAMFLADDKRMFLILNTAAKAMLMIMYAINGLWMSCIVNIGILTLNLYNTKERPKMIGNIVLTVLILAVSLSLDNSDNSSENIFLRYFPLASFICATMTIMFMKSYPLMILEICADSVLWAVYNLKHAMIMALTADLICVIMPAVKHFLQCADKYFSNPPTDLQSEPSALTA